MRVQHAALACCVTWTLGKRALPDDLSAARYAHGFRVIIPIRYKALVGGTLAPNIAQTCVVRSMRRSDRLEGHLDTDAALCHAHQQQGFQVPHGWG